MDNNYTLFNEAFHFSTTMPNQSVVKNTGFSLECIYCKSENTIELLADGSFRRCLNPFCRKQFRPTVKPHSVIPSHLVTANLKPRHPNDYIMNQQRNLINENKDITPFNNVNGRRI